MIWNNHGSWESDIPWQLHSQKATLCEALLQLQLQTFLLLNIHLSLWTIQLIFIALSVSVVRDQLLVELITIIGSYEMMKKFVNTQKNGGTWWPWRIMNPFLTSIALVIWSPWRHTTSPLPEVDDLIDTLGSRTVFPACELHQSKSWWANMKIGEEWHQGLNSPSGLFFIKYLAFGHDVIDHWGIILLRPPRALAEDPCLWSHLITIVWALKCKELALTYNICFTQHFWKEIYSSILWDSPFHKIIPPSMQPMCIKAILLLHFLEPL